MYKIKYQGVEVQTEEASSALALADFINAQASRASSPMAQVGDMVTVVLPTSVSLAVPPRWAIDLYKLLYEGKTVEAFKELHQVMEKYHPDVRLEEEPKPPTEVAELIATLHQTYALLMSTKTDEAIETLRTARLRLAVDGSRTMRSWRSALRATVIEAMTLAHADRPNNATSVLMGMRDQLRKTVLPAQSTAALLAKDVEEVATKAWGGSAIAESIEAALREICDRHDIVVPGIYEPSQKEG
jgi:hypothetical protein